MKILRILLSVIALLLFTGLLLLLAPSVYIHTSTIGRVYRSIDKVPPVPRGLVLGTSRRIPGGEKNPYFYNRIDAAARLYHAGKIKTIVASGAYHSRHYDEPKDMLKALKDRGVDEDAVVLDRKGFRTLDSVVRCGKKHNGPLMIISQDFHNRRALFIADHYDIPAIAFNAEPVRGTRGMKVKIREIFARIKALLDIYVLHTSPSSMEDCP